MVYTQHKNDISIDEPLNIDWDGNELLLSDILGTDEDMIQRPLEDDVDLQLLRQALEDLEKNDALPFHPGFFECTPAAYCW